jgi:S-adenosylmethionine:tRNA ribosyltransferase-isomerase
LSNDESRGAVFETVRYDYELPLDRIAQSPAGRRDESRLLVMDGAAIADREFCDLPALVKPGDLFVVNDTRVMRARLLPKRRGGGKAEVLLLHPTAHGDGTWEALVRPGQRMRVGDRLSLSPEHAVEITGRTDLGTRIVRFEGIDADAAMERYGLVPLPPYITTPPPDAGERYQTVYAAHRGSVAAPTAGLHFTQGLIDALRERGASWATVTLDVGAGTFRPVKTADIREHPMHAERYSIPAQTAEAIARTKTSGGRIIAVGTTSVRSLEDAALHSANGSVAPGSRWTNLFIYPGFQFRVVDALITNFHLPRSTLLMLVCAFAGTDAVLSAYAHAVRERYRFYSFGDAMFIAGAQP